jgi:Flp pilus assembly protein TadD
LGVAFAGFQITSVLAIARLQCRAMTESGTRRSIWVFCCVLAAAVVAAYWPALHCGFLNYDDPAYVTANPRIQAGLNWNSIAWALTTGHAANWHPLTWVSHMIDFQIYGLNPWGHHLTSVLFHAANSVLLFLLLTDMTGAAGRSAFVAAIFALHPLRVESVVWVSERKDVLSAFFGLLTLWAWFRFQTSKSKGCYALALVFFILGLMAKPMLVTLPLVFLLLDFWPLRREFSWNRIVERTPFFVLAGAACVVTYIVQDPSMENFPAGARWANAPVACVRYLSRIFWPSNLSFFYSYQAWTPLQVAGAVFLLSVISGLAVWRVRQQPYMAVGWAWFLGMLAPTIGLVQVGSQSMADRYTYLPGIGIGIMIVWAMHEFAPRQVALLSGILFLAVCSILTWREAHFYQNSQTVWRETLRQDPKCLVALDNLSRELIRSGPLNEALDYSRQALAIRPADPEAENNLALIFLHQGRLDDALSHARTSIALQPHNQEAYDTIGQACLKKGQPEQAIEAYRAALQIDPKLAEAWCNLGFALLQQHRIDDARDAYQKALQLDPNYALAHNDVGNILMQQGRMDEALAHFLRATQIKPDFGEAHYNMAEILLRKGRADEALAEYRKTLASLPNLAQARARIDEILRRQGGSVEH